MAGFTFKQFEIQQDRCAMKVGTDGVLLGAWAEGGQRILDIGSGTGLISLMMAQRFPEAQVWGIDIDPDACMQARENVAASPFADRVGIACCALQDLSEEHLLRGQDERMEMGNGKVLKEGEKMMEKSEAAKADGILFDAIVSNPPFFVNGLKNPDSKRAMARHSDSLPFPVLMKGVRRWLSDEGVFSAIVPADVLESFVSEAYCSGLSLVRQCGVKTVERKQPKRYLVAFSKRRAGMMDKCTEIMTDSEGNRSEWYAKITEEFYLE